MATGFPTKANWAAGDVLTASALDDLAGTVNLLNPTAKGNLISASAANTVALLAVGSDGQTLVADSSTSTGLRYQTIVNRNNAINGAMDIWQRGTSFNSFGGTSVYTADRYYAYRGGLAAGLTVSRQVTGDTTNLPNIQYATRIQRDSGNTSTAQILFLSDWESVNSIPLAGQTVTFSFYARAGANYSATSNAFSGILVTGTGTDQALRTVYTGTTNAISVASTLTTTWQRFQGTATLAATATQIGLNFNFTPTGTAGANDYVDVTGVQVELGSVATKFQRNGATIQGEFAACQRYYFRASGSSNSDNYGTMSGFGLATGTSGVSVAYQLPVTMRTGATSIDYANLSVYGGGVGGAGFVSVSAASLTRCTPNFAEIALTNGAVTTGAVYRLQSNNSSGSYLGLSAEL